MSYLDDIPCLDCDTRGYVITVDRDGWRWRENCAACNGEGWIQQAAGEPEVDMTRAKANAEAGDYDAEDAL